jgi:ABC-type enterochelin transport system ATPase subunit
MPCFTHVLYLKNGKIFKQGRKEVLMNSKTLSNALDYPLTIQEKSNRYYAASCQ